MFFGKENSFLGIDLGTAGVKMVELRKEKGRPVLFTYGLTLNKPQVALATAPLSTILNAATVGASEPEKKDSNILDSSSVKQVAELLRSVCLQARTRATTVGISIPASQVFHALVTLPIARKEELLHMLNAEIKKLLPYPIEDAQLDFQVIAKDEAQKVQRVMVNAVPRSLVAFYTAVSKEAGLKLDALESESIALARALVGRDSATTLLVDIGDERTNFFIVDNTFPITQHSIELGGNRMTALLKDALGIEGPLTEQIKKDLFSHLLSSSGNPVFTREKFLNLFNPVIDPIAKEIDYSLELYMRQSMTRSRYPEKIILTGGASYFPYLADHITDTFKIKTYIGDPWGRVVYQDGLKAVLRTLAPRMSVAIGLALRNVL